MVKSGVFLVMITDEPVAIYKIFLTNARKTEYILIKYLCYKQSGRTKIMWFRKQDRFRTKDL